ncbi:MAG: M20/M25/M40 family metallo-hydrolase [Alphaproteobacteria bacterium]|nr:M20/M25/M40 family metallo-hydrolase [Alphaproteobacteria bacterium]
MATARERILGWIDQERAQMIGFLQEFVRCRTPNPPGDTRSAAGVVTRFLDRHELPYRVIAPNAEMPNIVGSYDGLGPGRHLVLNGHMDVFPVAENGAGWTKDPWGGEIAEGKLYGRGACDMKCGTTASIMTYMLLHRLKGEFAGKLTLTAVSDEETFGPWGARYLMEHHPEVHGDCCLNGEPSGTGTVRFGERGPLWIEFTVRTPGSHGSYTHASKSATKLAMALAADLEELTKIEVRLGDNIQKAVDAGRAAMDQAMGAGAGDLVTRVTLNIGTIHGGAKVNMVPSHCTFEADFRMPCGMTAADLVPQVQAIVDRYPEISMRVTGGNDPTWCDPYHEMVDILRGTVESLGRPKPTPIVNLGGTDARLWRQIGVPAYVYGPSPKTMGSLDEHVDIEDFLHVVRTHALAACAYLAGR